MMKNQYLILIILFLIYSNFGNAQVGINESNPNQQLDINGKIEIGNDNSTPTEGTIRYNSQKKDFEGWNGSTWLSLTKNKNGWGDQSVTENISIAGENFAYHNETFVRLFEDNILISTYTDELFVSQTSFGPPITDHTFIPRMAIYNNLLVIIGYSQINFDPNTRQYHAYVYEKVGGNWNFVDIINDPLNDNLANFGLSLDVYEDYILIAAPYGDNANGRVYLYDRFGVDDWNLVETFFSSTPTLENQFGFRVSMDGNNIAISELGANKVYTYKDNFGLFGWTSNGTFTSPNNEVNFGFGIDLDNERLVVACNANDSFIYEKSNGIWLSTPTTTLNQLGSRAKLKGNYLVIMDSPSLHLYEYADNTWGEVAEFSSSDDGEFSFTRNLEITNEQTIITNVSTFPKRINFYYKN